MDIAAIKQQIEERANLHWQELSKCFNCGALPKIAYIMKPSKIAAFAYYNGIVEFNLCYAITEGIDTYDRTIAHELAHIVQFRCFPNAKQAHGREFRYILDSIFMPSTTYHTYNVRAAAQAVKQHQAAFDIDSI